MDSKRLLENAEWVRALALSLVHDADEAEDLVQETWLAALRGAPQGRSSLRPWLRKVIRNLAYISYRSRSRRQARERRAALSESVEGGLDSVEKLEQHRLLVDAVLGLKEPNRSIVVLRYLVGMSPAQIAGRVGFKPGAVRMRLKRSLDLLREELDRKHSGDRRAWIVALAPLTGLPENVARGGPASGSVLATVGGGVVLSAQKISVVIITSLIAGAHVSIGRWRGCEELTDASGSATLRGDADRQDRLRITREKYAPWEGPAGEAAAGGAAELDVVLERSAAIRGIVSGAGRPVFGAVVQVPDSTMSE